MSRIVDYIGLPANTAQGVSTDAAQSLEGAGFTVSSGVVGARISIENQPIRYTFGSTPTVDGGTGLGHVGSADTEILLESGAEVTRFKFISKVAGSAAKLVVTMYTE
jgi:hypothetical protein